MNHVRQKGARNAERAFNVYLHDAVVFLVRYVLHQFRQRNARVVDDRIHSAKSIAGGFQRADLIRTSNILLNGEHAASPFVRYCFCGVARSPIAYYNVETVRKQCFRDGQPDSFCAARHQSDSVLYQIFTHLNNYPVNRFQTILRYLSATDAI